MTGVDRPGQRLQALRARIGRLEEEARELEAALDEIGHGLRRVGERLERAGGGDRAAEAERARLLETRAATRRELEGNRRARDMLRAQADALSDDGRR